MKGKSPVCKASWSSLLLSGAEKDQRLDCRPFGGQKNNRAGPGNDQAVLSEVVVYQERRVEIRYAFAEK